MCASGLPGGQFSYVETSLALRGNGTFSNRWTLSVILESTTRSRQHGIEVRPGSLVIHRPNVEHDAVYGRNFKVACFSIRDEVLAKQSLQLIGRHLGEATLIQTGAAFERATEWHKQRPEIRSTLD
jgi:hypothetical protein